MPSFLPFFFCWWSCIITASLQEELTLWLLQRKVVALHRRHHKCNFCSIITEGNVISLTRRTFLKNCFCWDLIVYLCPISGKTSMEMANVFPPAIWQTSRREAAISNLFFSQKRAAPRCALSSRGLLSGAEQLQSYEAEPRKSGDWWPQGCVASSPHCPALNDFSHQRLSALSDTGVTNFGRIPFRLKAINNNVSNERLCCDNDSLGRLFSSILFI